MTPDEKETHMRRMLEHGKKVQAEFKRTNEEFEADCRRFWAFMQTADVRELFKL